MKTPILKYRPTRVPDHFGSHLEFGTPVTIWGDVDRGEGNTLTVGILDDEDVQINDVLIFQT